MTSTLISHPVAEALMPARCEACGGDGICKCDYCRMKGYDDRECGSNEPGCHGAGSLLPVLTWLVVEGEPCACDSYPATDKTLGTHDELVATIVRAIEAGERIGIETECAMCGGRSHPDSANWKPCPNCTKGRVPVGSVRPVRVLPIVPPGECPSRAHIERTSQGFIHWDPACAGDDDWGYVGVVDLSLYGPAESLVGRFAIEVEDARREP